MENTRDVLNEFLENKIEELKREGNEEQVANLIQAKYLLFNSLCPAKDSKEERVNHPKYYNSHPSGVECIDIIRYFNWNIGSTIKYCWRHGLKQEEGKSALEKEIEDLEKAVWCLQDEIKELKKKL